MNLALNIRWKWFSKWKTPIYRNSMRQMQLQLIFIFFFKYNILALSHQISWFIYYSNICWVDARWCCYFFFLLQRYWYCSCVECTKDSRAKQKDSYTNRLIEETESERLRRKKRKKMPQETKSRKKPNSA